jgi:CDGSH-type Zn-finger protein
VFPPCDRWKQNCYKSVFSFKKSDY